MRLIRARTMVAAALVFGYALSAPHADAHHSFAMYDRGQVKSFTGKVIRLVPASNHAVIIFEVLGDDGKPVLNDQGKTLTWQVESAPASALANQGLTVKTLPGQYIAVSLYPLRDGRSQGAMSAPLIMCGTELPKGGCNAETGKVTTIEFD